MKLVLLPGMDGTGEFFGPLLRTMGKDVEPIVVRYPADAALGYGELEDLVRPRLPVDEPYVLLGESFSGPIAIAIAASRPAQLKALVLCGTFARHPQPRYGAPGPLVNLVTRRIPLRLTSFFLLGSASTAQRRAWLAEVLSKVGAAVLRARLRAVLAVDVTPLLDKITVPTLYLQATRDRLVPRSAARLIQRHLPGTRVVPIDAPHFLLQLAPERAAAALRTFVRERVTFSA